MGKLTSDKKDAIIQDEVNDISLPPANKCPAVMATATTTTTTTTTASKMTEQTMKLVSQLSLSKHFGASKSKEKVLFHLRRGESAFRYRLKSRARTLRCFEMKACFGTESAEKKQKSNDALEEEEKTARALSRGKRKITLLSLTLSRAFLLSLSLSLSLSFSLTLSLSLSLHLLW